MIDNRQTNASNNVVSSYRIEENELTNSMPKTATYVSTSKRAKKATLMQRLGLGVIATGIMITGGLSLNHMNEQHAHANPVAPISSHTVVSTSDSLKFASGKVQMAEVAMQGTDYRSMARAAAARYGINPNLYERQIQQESGFNPNARSGVGAIGIAQFMPATAASMGVNPYDVASSLDGGARLMAQLSSQFGGNYAKALAGYNAGPGAVQSAVSRGGAAWISYLPYETQHYIRVIMG